MPQKTLQQWQALRLCQTFLRQPHFRNRRQKKCDGANNRENNEKPADSGNKKQKFHKIQRFEHNLQTVNVHPLRVKP